MLFHKAMLPTSRALVNRRTVEISGVGGNEGANRNWDALVANTADVDTLCLIGASGTGPTRPAQLLNSSIPKTKSPTFSAGLIVLSGQRPTLPPTYAGSTIGAEGLNFRVRDGNGCDPLA